MPKTILTLLAAALLLLGGCSKPKLLTDVEVDTSSPLISDDRTTQITGGALSELIDSMRLVPLDESCLVGNIKRIRHANSHLYVLTEDQMLLFDDNGRFVKTVAVKGQGPEEVLDFCDYDVDSTGIIILDPAKFLFFDTNGNFNKSIPNKYGYGFTRLLPENRGWIMKTISPAKNNHTIVAFDCSGDTIFTTMQPYKFDRGYIQDLFHLNDSVIIHPINPAGTNEIFTLNTFTKGSNIIPVSVSGDPLSAKDYDTALKDGRRKIDTPKLLFTGFTDNHSLLYFRALERGHAYHNIYDKMNGKAFKISENSVKNDLSIELEEGYLLDMVFRTSSDDDYFVTWMSDPKATYEQSAKLNPRFKAEYAKLADIDDESNPVVVFLKFKSPAEFANKTE